MSYQIEIWNGHEILTTHCPGRGCVRSYSIDSNHPLYADVKAALERGDRSVLFCYHDLSNFTIKNL